MYTRLLAGRVMIVHTMNCDLIVSIFMFVPCLFVNQFCCGDRPFIPPVGMNLGLQDSYNLTWKLALVMHGLAPESLLDTYEVERQVPKLFVRRKICEISQGTLSNHLILHC